MLVRDRRDPSVALQIRRKYSCQIDHLDQIEMRHFLISNPTRVSAGQHTVPTAGRSALRFDLTRSVGCILGMACIRKEQREGPLTHLFEKSDAIRTVAKQRVRAGKSQVVVLELAAAAKSADEAVVDYHAIYPGQVSTPVADTAKVLPSLVEMRTGDSVHQ